MTDWQWLQIGVMAGQTLTLVLILWKMGVAFNSKIEELTREHYHHREKVAEQYAKKEEVEKVVSKLEQIRVELQSMFIKFSEKLEQNRGLRDE